MTTCSGVDRGGGPVSTTIVWKAGSCDSPGAMTAGESSATMMLGAPCCFATTTPFDSSVRAWLQHSAALPA